MLVLTRKVGERIIIGENVVLTVVSQQGDRVKLGFEAPHHVAIHRQEVFERVQSETASPTAAPSDLPGAIDSCGSACL